jgi:hypothetical protein
MHRQVLGLRQTVLGKAHPNTLTSMNNLASVLWNQDHLKIAFRDPSNVATFQEASVVAAFREIGVQGGYRIDNVLSREDV